MNSLERFQRRLRGDPVDRPPNFDIMMIFAVHHIGQQLSHYYLDHKVLVEANLAVLEGFSLDIVQAISDPFREAADFGLQVQFPDDGLPLRQMPLLKDPSELSRLKAPNPAGGGRMSDRLEAVRILHEKVGGEVPIMGWVEGALAEANVLRGDISLMTDLYDRPEWVEEFLERCSEVEIAFAREQVKAGADMIGLGDAIASQISAPMYERYALPYEKRIFAAVHEMGALARLHICGDTMHILGLMAQSGADIIDLDWMVDMRRAIEICGEAGPALCGNFDPVAVMLRGTPERVAVAVNECLKAGGQRCISAAGCEIPDGTPRQNLHAQAQTLRAYQS